VVATLCVTISVIFSLFILTILIFTEDVIATIFSVPSLFIEWLYLMPPLLILYGINIVFLTYLNFLKDFKEISKSRIIKTIVIFTVSLVCIFFLKDLRGLLL